MEELANIGDPLAINLRKQTTVLLAQLPEHSPYSHRLQNATSRREILNTLSYLLSLPACTLAVATAFRPILLDLCARWLHDEENELERFEALCLLLEIHVEVYPVLAAFLRRPNRQEGPLSYINQVDDITQLDAGILHRQLLAYYRILQANRSLPEQLVWPIAPLSRLIYTPHPDTGVRFLAIRCLSLQTGMMEGRRVELEKDVIGDVNDIDCPIGYGMKIDGSALVVDGWVMPGIEEKRIADARNALLEPQDYCLVEENEIHEPIHPAELSPFIANVHGVFMLRSTESASPSSDLFVETTSAVQSLRILALHHSLRVPTLLTSAPSSGKSLLLSQLAQILHPDARNHIVTIHLADTSLDPRSLLGSYVSSSTNPGTFEWKEGVLVRAMREGKWVVFANIDKASLEVLGVIKPLVESLGLDKYVGGRALLNVPNRGTVVADDGFAIYATRSVVPSRNGTFPVPTFFGAHKFHEVVVPAPSAEDLRLIIETKFKRLAGAASSGLIRLWEAVKALGTASSLRDVGLRELDKLCTRVEHVIPHSQQVMDVDLSDPAFILPIVFPNPTVREDIYLEARDVFFGQGATTASARVHLEAVAAIVAEHVGLSPDRRDWLLHDRIPEFEIQRDVNGRTTAVRVGSTCLRAKAQISAITAQPTRPFAMHKPAVQLLARISTAVSLNDPVLLTGETGTGKTSAVTHLAALLHRPLIALNMSNQTESADLVGGFKPVDARVPGGALLERFGELFASTFSRKKNARFEESVRKAVLEGKWKRAVGLWREAVKLAKEKIRERTVEDGGSQPPREGEAPRKRRKTEQDGLNVSAVAWEAFEQDVHTFEVQHVQGKSKFAFAFVEGLLVKALRAGDWILLDEINLATPETLECVSSLLSSPTASITLTEQGSLEPIPRHPDFRLFACMNPATDVGKKDLPPNIRARFTEIDVPPPDADKETLLSIVDQYIGRCAVGDRGAVLDVAEFYLAVKQLAEARKIADGSNHRPHFSMRTLARALTFAADMASTFSLRRALWEGCLMTFTMVLDEPSAAAVIALAQKHLLAGVRNPRSLLTREPAPPQLVDSYLKVGPFYLKRGPLPEDPAESYIMTPSVEKKLIDLARIISAKRFPVLIEGPTSAGKTSSIEYLAKRTGHRFVRINNHEHTDIQEYLGSYVSDARTGKLIFQDGLLVRALRNGDWIVLDELNLAPTDVLEALNRLLDDNRELVVPETQEVVRPHPHFMLFATQNPPGLYAGRKVLSRAFRNRFLEVHFDDVPQAELETILCQRCRIAPSYGQRIVSVFRELQKRRQSSRVFESKQGFATLRDLFRWAQRDALDYQELAENGYMLLAERARRDDDKAVVKEVIESIMKVHIDESKMYNMQARIHELSEYLGCSMPLQSSLVWTSAMQRLFILVARALRFNEPVLLVGETGCGKTSVCQLYAEIDGKELRALNCHQNTETADLIGGLRPIRNRAALESEALLEASAILREMGAIEPQVDQDRRSLVAAIDALLKSGTLNDAQLTWLRDARAKLERLSAMFEWRDGPLVQAMRKGDVFLLDEISLADDSVLERINSVLEPERSIVLAERGGDSGELPLLKAVEGFKLVATMNPGGDYGKKELSPALRNRFTEIWVPPLSDRRDFEAIVDSLWRTAELRVYTAPILNFVEWLCARVNDTSVSSIRDILTWVNFSNVVDASGRGAIPTNEIFHHAAQMTYLDGLASLPQLSSYSRDALAKLHRDAFNKLHELVPIAQAKLERAVISDPASEVQLGFFAIPKGPKECFPHQFNLQAPTTQDNVMRVVRACQLSKPILLEGSPGVGKTSLVTALANLCGYHLCRINLSDQTDIMDLFGSDLPVEGEEPGRFDWKDAEFLRALQEGHWVLLDEMNLAPQAILEGLNAVLDHRGTVYIPELGRSFTRHPAFRIFAAQNPLSQGGGRKGLPKSFVNRFTKVYVQELTPSDLLLICQQMFPTIPEDILRAMISFTSKLSDEVQARRDFARQGAPWEFNLRDVIRWATLLKEAGPQAHPSDFLDQVFLERFRTGADRSHARALFHIFFPGTVLERDRHLVVTPSHLQLGHTVLTRQGLCRVCRPGSILQGRNAALGALATCVANGWLTILVGERGSGKTSIVRSAAYLCGRLLHELHINSATDSSDLLGSFEEVDSTRHKIDILEQVENFFNDIMTSGALSVACIAAQRDVLRRVLATDGPSVAALQTALQSAADALGSLVSLPQSCDARRLRLSTSIQACLHSASHVGKLEWVDGPLVRALQDGHWILLDGANMCNPSVLDRLNSLCELGGSLVLSERGQVDGTVQNVKPHSNFRLFMSVDPQYGELSRAMRNRGLEVCLLDILTHEDARRVMKHLHLPVDLAGQELRNASLSYEVSRRGLLRIAHPATVKDWSASELMGTDCASAANVHTAPFIDLVDESSLRPASHFLASTMVPSYSGYLMRFIRSHAQRNHEPYLAEVLRVIEAVSHSRVSHAICEQKRQWGVTIGESKDLILSRHLDILRSPISASRNVGDETDIAHVIDALRLLVTTTLDEEDGMGFSQESAEIGASGKRNLSDTRRAHAVRAARSLSEAVRVEAHGLLARVNVGSIAEMTEARMVIELMTYVRHLRWIIRRAPLDYSAMQVFVKWIVQRSATSSPSHDAIHLCARTLEGIVSLRSGLLLVEIWVTLASLRPSDASRAQVDRLAHAENEGCFSSLRPSGPNDGTEDSALSSLRALELMSLWTLPAERSAVDEEKLAHVTDVMIRNAQHSSHERGCRSVRIFDSIVLDLELAILSQTQAGTETVSQYMEEFLNFGRLCCDLTRLIPYQQLRWDLETEQGIPVIIMRAHKQWMEGVWNTHNSPQPHHPYSLVHPVDLHAILEESVSGTETLDNLQSHEAMLRRRLEFTCMHLIGNAPTRTRQVSMMFAEAVCTVLACASSSGSNGPNVASILPRSSLSAIHAAITMLRQEERPALVPLKEQLLPMLQELLSAKDPQDVRELKLLSRCWVALSTGILQLYVPDTPVDPAAMQRCAADFWASEKAMVSQQLELHLAYELHCDGSLDNDSIRYLRRLLAEIEHAAQANIQRQIADRDDVPRLHSFWTEVLQLVSQVLSPSKLQALLTDIETGAPHADNREVVVQESLSAFIQRLDTIYPDFSDISGPIQLALLYAKLGIHLMAEGVKGTNATQENYLSSARAIIAFPSLKSAYMLQRVEIPRSSSASAVVPSLVQLAGLALEAAVTSDVQAIQDQTEAIFEQIYGLWAVEQSRSAQAEREAQSLYRHQNDAVTEAELEEQDFLATFPQFEDVLEDTSVAVPDSMGAPTAAKRPTLFDATRVAALGKLYQSLYSTDDENSPVQISELFTSLRHSALKTLMDEGVGAVPGTLDQESRAYQVTLLHQALSLFDESHARSSTYNFYMDANVPESKRAITALRNLQSRLATLVQEWPDQMVLQHLKARCDAALCLHISSPVAKILSALEQLVHHIDDWEMYANRENTLKAHQQVLIGLIVDWRRLELSCWQSLLRAQAEAFSDGVYDWWFRLYEASVRGVMTAMREESEGRNGAVTKYLDDLVPLLDEFITSSPIGQYEARLSMLRAFSTHAEHLSLCQPDDHETFIRVQRILTSTWRYYCQFTQRVRGTLSARQAELEKEVRDFIKLASWKDINVHALKQSAQRSHKQLYKVIRKFRDVLRQPAKECFKLLAEHSPELSLTPGVHTVPILAGVDIAPPEFPYDAELPSFLANLGTTYKNFRALSSGRLVDLIAPASVESLSELSGEIISTSQSLAKSSPPSDASPTQRTKFLKALLNRKRRAWSDLLKELKRIGLSANVRPEVLEQLRNLRWVREQEVLAFPEHCKQEVQRADDYFGRISNTLPELRNLMSNHHQDIGTRELQRSLAFVESGLAMAIDTRRSIDRAGAPFDQLRGLIDRLQVLASDTAVPCKSNQLSREYVIRMEAYMDQVVHALEEMLIHLRTHNRCSPAVAIPQETLEDIQSFAASSKEHASRISTVVRNVKLASVLVLLADEAQIVHEASAHIRSVCDALQRWSDGPVVVAYFAKPIAAWLREVTSTESSSASSYMPDTDNTGSLIEALLLSMQALLAVSPAAEAEPTADSFVRENTHLATRLVAALNLDGVLTRTRSVLASMGQCSPADMRRRAQRVLPFLLQYSELARHHLTCVTNWTASIFKLEHVICSIVFTLAKEGFCQPPDAEESGEGGDGMEVQADGTGLGDGSGAENVSKEIQDESQVEGLQGEDEGADEDVERAEEGNALEMSEDFGGQMQDVPEGDEEDEGDDESDVEPDEQIGDLDASDPSAVDEKLWGDEPGPQDSEEDGGQSKDDHSHQQQQDSEMVAKDETGTSRERKENGQQGEDPAKKDEEEAPPDAGLDDTENATEEDQEDGAQNGPEGAPVDEHIEEANALDLPDDIDLDAGKDKAEQMDDEFNLDDGAEEDDTSIHADDEPTNEDLTAEEAEGDQPLDDRNQAVDTAVDEDIPMEEQGEGAVAKADLHRDGGDSGQGQGASAGDAPDEAMDVDGQPDVGDDKSAGETVEAAQSSANAAEQSSGAEDTMQTPMDAEVEQSLDRGGGGDSARTSRSQQSSVPQTRPQLQKNPLRSLGDALREISRQLDDIMESTHPAEPPQDSQPDMPGPMEYLEPDDNASHTQALGPATQEEEIAKLDELRFAADDSETRDVLPAEDEERVEDHTMDEISAPHPQLQGEGASEARTEGIERALTQADVNSGAHGDNKSATAVPAGASDTVKPLDELSREVEIQLREWQAEGHPSARSGDIWRLYESLTHDLSYSLCEQLRLILEPTQATRLKGDYRTGKRLNMKKIIPYIASEFTKDKIWLRRTRPSQREYQVLIALDDSRSMAESHSVHLAYETLALVSKALSRLEVGDIAIAKFGEAVEVLHSFDGGPFTDQAGTKVIDAFHFDQKATQVLSLVESSLELLERARERRAMASASAADLWQLEIIISDGICQDHEKLRTVLRKAEEQRIMVVFIILDSLHTRSVADGSSAVADRHQNSILRMSQAVYKNIDGRMDLHVERYLDTFPFEYYVVLRDVEALPDVLAGTLKQFFERIAED